MINNILTMRKIVIATNTQLAVWRNGGSSPAEKAVRN